MLIPSLNSLARHNDWTVVHIADDEWAAKIDDEWMAHATILADDLMSVELTHDGDLIAAMECAEHDAISVMNELIKDNI